jgi:hypothetical protein
MLKLGFYDWSTGGHNETYLVALYKASIELGLSPSLLLPEDIFRGSLTAQSLDNVVVLPARRSFSRLSKPHIEVARLIWNVINLRKSIRTNDIEQMFFPNILSYHFIDKPWIYRLLGCRFSLNFVQVNAEFVTNLSDKHVVERSVLSDATRVSKISTIDRGNRTRLSEVLKRPVILAPDVCNLDSYKVPIRKPQRFTVTVAGQIDSRKAIPELKRWFVSKGHVYCNLRIVGYVDITDLNVVESLSVLSQFDNCEIINKKIQDGPEFNKFIETSSAIWLAYKDFPYNSNVLIKAAHYQVPVVTVLGSLLATIADDIGIGSSISSYNVDEVDGCIKRLSIDRDPQATQRRLEFIDFNSSTKSLSKFVAEIVS